MTRGRWPCEVPLERLTAESLHGPMLLPESPDGEEGSDVEARSLAGKEADYRLSEPVGDGIGGRSSDQNWSSASWV